MLVERLRIAERLAERRGVALATAEDLAAIYDGLAAEARALADVDGQCVFERAARIARAGKRVS